MRQHGAGSERDSGIGYVSAIAHAVACAQIVISCRHSSYPDLAHVLLYRLANAHCHRGVPGTSDTSLALSRSNAFLVSSMSVGIPSCPIPMNELLSAIGQT